MGIVFQDTDAKPTGRKARNVSDDLLGVLADSAARGVAKVAEADKEVISELLKDLGSAAVRKRYTLTVATTKGDKPGDIRLTFHAVAKPPEPASGGQEQEQEQERAPAQARKR